MTQRLGHYVGPFVLGMSVVLAGCSSSTPSPGAGPTALGSVASTSTTTQSATTTPGDGGPTTGSPGTDASPSGGPGASATDVSYLPAEPVWWSGFGIQLVRAHLDAQKRVLSVDLKLTNTAVIDVNLGSTRTAISVRSNERVTPGPLTSDTVPQGTTIRSTLDFADVADDFDLSSAELVFGEVGLHQAVFALGDTHANSTAKATRPRILASKVVMRNAHTGATFASTDVRLIPAACSGSNNRDVSYVPLASDHMVLELVGKIWSPSMSVGGVVAQVATATSTGGIKSIAEPGLSLVLGGDAAPEEGLHLCFPIPADTHDKLTLTFDTRLVGEDFVKAAGTLQLP